MKGHEGAAWSGGPNLYQAKFARNQVQWGSAGGPKIKVAQNGLKHILVLE